MPFWDLYIVLQLAEFHGFRDLINSEYSNEEIDVLRNINMLNDRDRRITFKALKAFVCSMINN